MPKPGRAKDKVVEKKNPLEIGIKIPSKDVEALLVAHDTSNRVGVTAVCEEIRRMAQEQNPGHFQS